MATPLVTVDEIPEVRRILRETGPRAATNIARRVVVGIAKTARNRMRSRVPKKSRTLERAIRSRRRRGRPGFPEAAVFITHGPGARHDAYYWHFVEFGTVASSGRTLNKGTALERSTRAHAATAAQPFIVPTVVEMRGELPGIYLKEFGRQLEKELVKVAKKGGITR